LRSPSCGPGENDAFSLVDRAHEAYPERVFSDWALTMIFDAQSESGGQQPLLNVHSC